MGRNRFVTLFNVEKASGDVDKRKVNVEKATWDVDKRKVNVEKATWNVDKIKLNVEKAYLKQTVRVVTAYLYAEEMKIIALKIA